MTPAELTDRMCRWLAGEYRAVLWEIEGEVAGYALFRDEEDFVYLCQFFVTAAFRRCGIGRTAIEWLSQNAWGEARRLRLDVLCHNEPAIAFWRSVGFTDYCLMMDRRPRASKSK
jgi:predicted acetyltransferase